MCWKQLWFVVLVSGGLCAALPASADPLPGQVLKFSQKPMIETFIFDDEFGTDVPYYGHDELSTAYGVFDTATGQVQQYVGQYMADDFADRFDTPVVHVRWWGSYLGNEAREAVDKFLISFESDIPDTDGHHEDDGFSRPGEPLLNQIVHEVPAGSALLPGSGTFTEKLIHPGDPAGGEALYEYNAELYFDKPFPQERDKVYWLKIVALVDVPANVPIDDPSVPKWGWHNRDYTVPNPLASPAVVPGEHDDMPAIDPGYPSPVYHFQDDAVTGEIFVGLNPNMPNMPNIDQTTYFPTHYIDELDGPGPRTDFLGTIHGGIGQFSKDLAFELYTIPEPSSIVLCGLAVALVGLRYRRRD